MISCLEQIRKSAFPIFGTARPRLVKQLAACTAATLLAPIAATAAEFATTAPRGIYTVKVPGTTIPGTPVRTYLGIQLLPDTRFVGQASNVSGNTISFSSLGNPAALAVPNKKSYIHVQTGAGVGFVTDIEQFRSSDLLCAENLVPWIHPGDTIRIRNHSQLADLLGATNSFELGAGTSADTADNVVVWDPDTQQERVYYFNSTRSRWEEKNIVADAGNANFRFPYGFYIVRRSPGTLRIALSGEIGADSVLLPVRSVANVFSLPVNLSASLESMIRTEGDFAVISGPNAKRSDILTFEEPTTGLQKGPFYHLSRPPASGWREVGVNGSAAPVSPLDFLSTLILRREGNPGRVFISGSLTPSTTPRPVLPPEPEPGEIPLKAELRYPPPNSDVTLTVEVSNDLQTWSPYSSTVEMISPGRVSFTLPSGQGRSFYRLKVSTF